MPEPDAACPRCGEAMAYRLAEYECPRCGYFISAAALKRGPQPAPHTAGGGLAALPLQSGRRSLAQYEDPGRGARRWLRLKQAYLLVLFIGLSGGTLLKAQLAPDFTVTMHFAWLVALASLVACGLASLVLFIDWLAFRVFGQVVTVLVLGACGYEVYLWDGQDQLRLALIVFNGLLILGLAAINQFDIMGMR